MLFIIAGAVFGLLIAVGLLIAMNIDRSVVVRRMAQIGDIREREEILVPELTKAWTERVAAPMLGKATGWIGTLAPASLLESSRRRLQRAGQPGGITPEAFLMLRAFAVLAGLVVAVLILTQTHLPAGIKFLLVLAAATGGVLAPSWALDRVAEKRAGQIRKALPNVIDLLVVSVEAGLGLDGAITEIISRESGPLTDEFNYALAEIRLGKTRRDAWRNMADRAQVRDLSAFMAAVCQAEELGSSISKLLRTHSETLRIKRSIAVRELANKIPVKMLFPLIFCIFPAMFIVILGPGAITVMHTLGKFGG